MTLRQLTALLTDITASPADALLPDPALADRAHLLNALHDIHSTLGHRQEADTLLHRIHGRFIPALYRRALLNPALLPALTTALYGRADLLTRAPHPWPARLNALRLNAAPAVSPLTPGPQARHLLHLTLRLLRPHLPVLPDYAV